MRGRILFSLFISLLLGQAAMAQQTHRIKAGESLWTIARKYDVTVEALREANGLKNDVIWEGRDLTIPPRTIPTEPPVRPVPTPAPTPAPTQRPTTPTKLPDTATEQNSDAPKVGSDDILRIQVLLDRAGFGPGVIDGKEGYFTRKAFAICQKWNPKALEGNIGPVQQIRFESAWRAYVDSTLPGSGNTPDFKALTADKRPLMYYRVEEFIAERYHCSVKLLKSLNPGLDLESLTDGKTLLVPNVEPFEIEKYLSTKATGKWGAHVGRGSGGRRIEISKGARFLLLWEGKQLVHAFPVTVNAGETPEGTRTIGEVVPGPVYERRKTGLSLLAGPNSPVGIIWCQLGDGYGIHGTSNPDSIGRSVSSGCIRLANWDVVRLAGLIKKGETVRIVGD